MEKWSILSLRMNIQQAEKELVPDLYYFPKKDERASSLVDEKSQELRIKGL